MLRRLLCLFLFLLPLAAMAAGEDGDTLSVTWVDGRKFVMIGDRDRPVFDCFFEDERAYVERLERDSADLFLDRFYRRAQDSAVSIPDEEGRHDIVIPEMQVKICYPSRPYWLMAFYSALSEESLEKIERIKEAQIVLNFVYDQSGKIVYMRFHMVGEHWLSIPLEEWARLALSMEKYVLLYDIFKHSEDRPERYFVKQDFFVLYLYLLLDPRQNFDF